MHYGLKQDLLHKGQYGSNPGKQAQTICLLGELQLDHSLLTRTLHCNFDSDLTGGYDFILLSLSILVVRGMGIYRNVVFVHAQTLEDPEYKTENRHHCV